jgi:hypothetical protein
LINLSGGPRARRLAAVGCRLQRLLPALAGNEATLGIDVEKDIVEALLAQPGMQCRRRGVVGARMTDEQA